MNKFLITMISGKEHLVETPIEVDKIKERMVKHEYMDFYECKKTLRCMHIESIEEVSK